MKLCRSGRHEKEGPGLCRKCRLETMRKASARYRTTPARAQAEARWRATPGYRAAVERDLAKRRAFRAAMRQVHRELGVHEATLKRGRKALRWIENGKLKRVTDRTRAMMLRLAASYLEKAHRPAPPAAFEQQAKDRGWRAVTIDGDPDTWVSCAKGSLVGRGASEFTARTEHESAGASLEAIPGAQRLPTAAGTWVVRVPIAGLARAAEILEPARGEKGSKP